MASPLLISSLRPCQHIHTFDTVPPPVLPILGLDPSNFVLGDDWLIHYFCQNTTVPKIAQEDVIHEGRMLLDSESKEDNNAVIPSVIVCNYKQLKVLGQIDHQWW